MNVKQDNERHLVVVRPARMSDRSSLATLYHAMCCALEPLGYDVPSTPEAAWDWVENQVEPALAIGAPCLMAIADGLPRGMTTSHFLEHPHTGERLLVWDALYVAPQCRRLGVARAMADRVIERARELGIRQVLGEIVNGNTASAELVSKLGFKDRSKTVKLELELMNDLPPGRTAER